MFFNRTTAAKKVATHDTSSTPQNLILWSEVLTNAIYFFSGLSVTDNISGDLDEVNVTSGTSYIRQHFTSVPGTTYYFSFEAQLPASGAIPDVSYSVYDWSNGANIIAPTSYYSSISTTVTRVTFSFTAPAGCTDTGVYMVRDPFATGIVWIGKVWVYTGTGKSYVTTTTTPVN